MLEMNEVSLVYEADRRNFAGGKHQVLDAISFDLCENETLRELNLSNNLVL